MKEQTLNGDQNLAHVKNTISYILPGSRVILFGSRSRGDDDCRSDYDIYSDIIVVCDQEPGY
jgi:predicted nucleotidyltransferase